jgi:VWFA-related protein
MLTALIQVPAFAQRGGGSAGGARPAPAFGPTGHGVVDYSVPAIEGPASITVETVREGDVKFSTQSELVLVPVVVTDKSTHNPVHGLAQSDFTIEENGRPQKIASFEEIQTVNTPVAAPPAANGIYSNVVGATSEPRRISIILLDTVNTPFLDQAYARGQIVKFLSEHISPSDLISLVVLDEKGTHIIHDFTGDPAVLVAATKRIAGKLPTMYTEDTNALAAALNSNESPNDGPVETAVAAALTGFVLSDFREAEYRQGLAIQTTLNSFLAIAQEFAGIPGRKSLIWMSGGLPFVNDQAGAVPGFGLAPLYERAIQALGNANIAVYPIDARGLVTTGFSGTSAPRAGGTFFRRRALQNESNLQQQIQFNFEDFAQMTGGRAFYNRNDLDTGIDQALKNGSDYYMLAYYLDQKDRKAGWRKLKVGVSREHVDIQSRSGFFVTASTTNFQTSKPYDMLATLNSPLDATGLPLGMRWLGTEKEGDKRRIAFALGSLPKVIGVDPAKHNRLDVDVAVLVKKPGGEQVAKWARNVDAELQPNAVQALENQGFGYPGQLELAPGTYDVKFVVRDNTSGRLGSVTAPLTVQ